MKQALFEQRVLEIWLRSRITLTAAHVQHLTGATREKVVRWMEAMTVSGQVDADVDDQGEMIWKVRGAERAAGGPTTIAEWERLGRLTSDAGEAGRALGLATRAAGLTRSNPAAGDHKSVVASGALSLFLGPYGWLYAAPLREAVPAAVAFTLLASFVPHFILMPLLGIAAPLSGLAGVYYAMRHNQTGERTGLFSDKKPR